MVNLLKEYIERLVNEEMNNFQYPEGSYKNKQFRIPFEEYGNGNSYIDIYIDWLKAVSKKGTLPKPSVNFKEMVYRGISRFHNNKHANRDVVDKNHVNRRNYMTTKELHQYMSKKSTLFNDIKFDDNGNLYVERQIGVNIDDIHEESPTLFNDLTQSYNNTVGGCWAFREGMGQAYCSGKSNFYITFKGYMLLDDIYWDELIRLETRSAPECEVRTYPNGRVQLEEIELYDKKKGTKIVLSAKDFDGPRIINSTYLGNNTTFEGNYAKLGFEKIGYENKFIDREGNEYKNIEAIFYKKLESGKKIEDIVSEIKDLGNGLRRICFGDKYNLIDKDDNLLSPNQWFDDCWNFKNGFTSVELNNKCNWIDIQGNILFPNQWFDGVGVFDRDGFAKIKLNKKFNFIDTQGNLLSPNQWFDWCDFFDRYGFANVELNKKCNIINKQGNLLSPNQWFDQCGYFINGFAEVKLNGYVYLIDQSGNLYDEETKQPIQKTSQQNEMLGNMKNNRTSKKSRFRDYLNRLVKKTIKK